MRLFWAILLFCCQRSTAIFFQASLFLGLFFLVVPILLPNIISGSLQYLSSLIIIHKFVMINQKKLILIFNIDDDH